MEWRAVYLSAFPLHYTFEHNKVPDIIQYPTIGNIYTNLSAPIHKAQSPYYMYKYRHSTMYVCTTYIYIDIYVYFNI